MKGRRVLPRLLASSIIFAVLAALAVTLVVRGVLLDRTARALEARVQAEVGLAERWLRRSMIEAPAEAQRRARELSTLLEARVELYGPRGQPWGEEGGFDETPAEVDAALHTGFSWGSRGALGEEGPVLQVARRIESEGRILGVVRLSVPVSPGLESMVPGVLGLSTWIFPLLLLACLGTAYVARRLVLDRDPVRRAARRLTRELYEEDAFEDLAALLERTRMDLVERLARQREEAALTSTVLESMREGVLAVDGEGKVVFHNPAVFDLLHPRTRSLQGRLLFEVTRQAAVGEAYDEVLGGGRSAERKLRVGNGHERHVELRVVALEDAQGERGALGVLFDVTRMEVLESIRRTFIANVSHELRTPLASIKAYTETLLEGALDEPENNRGFLEVVLRHAHRMEALVEDLTDLSLIESGAISLERSRVDLGGLVEEVVDGLEPRTADKSIRLKTDLPAGLVVEGDKMRLEQVLFNVVDNAVKFGPPESTVWIRGWSREEEVVLAVEDEGQGIPPADLEKVFHRFYRVDKARSRELGGTGLGLSIVKHLMHLHGGHIRAENRDQKGARFVLVFPAAPKG